MAPHQMPAQPAAMHALSTISCFGVLQAATHCLHESESHFLIPGPARGGEENSIYNKQVPRNPVASFVDTIYTQRLQVLWPGLWV